MIWYDEGVKKISEFLADNPRYKRFQKPLEAAKVCEVALSLSKGRFGVISFRDGLLSLAVESSSAAANLQAESQKIISTINQKLGTKSVKRLRFKII